MINKNSPIPLYHQIYTVLKQRIEQKVYSVGTKLPSENALADEFGVTRITARNAIKLLQAEGLINTQKGLGSTVNSSKMEQSLFRFYSFGRNFSKDDFNPTNCVVSAIQSPATEVELTKLQLTQPSKVMRIVRVRSLNHIPVVVEISSVPVIFAPDILDKALEEVSIYDLLENTYNHPITRSLEYLDTINCDAYFADLLKLDIGKAIFSVERITFTIDDKPMEYRISYIRGDKFRFSIEF